jgi:hypothetical protein
MLIFDSAYNASSIPRNLKVGLLFQNALFMFFASGTQQKSRFA